MDVLNQYGSDSDAEETTTRQEQHASSSAAAPSLKISKTLALSVNATPFVDLEEERRKQMNEVDPTKGEMYHNPRVEHLWKPVLGPANPHIVGNRVAPGYQNHRTGYVMDHAMHEVNFNEQLYSFDLNAKAEAPEGGVMVGEGNGAMVPIHGSSGNKRRRMENLIKDAEDIKAKRDAALAIVPAEPTEEQKQTVEKLEQEESEREKKRQQVIVHEEKTNFHGKSDKDYLGRSWVLPPRDWKEIDPDEAEAFLPKKLIHTWAGHAQGVSSVRFFPKYGHLLLSAGMDGKVKIWDVANLGGCMRTYLGHSKAVRDVNFSADGRKFLTTSYDRFVKCWDTETGKCIGRFTNKKIPYMSRLYPDNEHEFLMACADKKIHQWDMRSGEIVQEYNEHLGPVNTISYVDDNRRFVSTSDDKKMFVWEYGIPVVIKHIAEPHMHSMPATAMSPSNKWMLCQSLDNQLLTFETGGRFRMNRKKRFSGHVVAGYACQPTFSNDGRYVASGDASGNCWFWDWKTTRVFKKIKCHDSVCICVQWHPIEQSKVVTCGWDGTIKYWD